jgi:tetratricopeptide (TPR) repeat protein
VSQLLIGLLGVLMSTNQPAAVSNLVARSTGVSVAIPSPNDPVEKDYQQLLADDDAAQAEVDAWIQDNAKFAEQGAGLSRAALAAKVNQRLDKVKESYRAFLLKHPDHARARLAFASFLGDIGEEREAVEQAEKARESEPKNPAAWNNLANLYGHRGPVKKAFEYYEKAIELGPNEPVYLQNFATTVYLFRKDAREHYGIDEQQVFTKALGLYERAVKLDPENFRLVTDWASSYYGIKPPRYDDALAAWEYALKIARDDIERQGVQIHLARFKINMKRFDEARAHLAAVQHEMYGELKERALENLKHREQQARESGPPKTGRPEP